MSKVNDRLMELREKSVDELIKLSEENRAELFALKFQVAVGSVEKTDRIVSLRKDIARIMTLLSERKKAGENTNKIIKANYTQAVEKAEVEGKAVRKKQRELIEKMQNEQFGSQSTDVSEDTIMAAMDAVVEESKTSTDVVEVKEKPKPKKAKKPTPIVEEEIIVEEPTPIVEEEIIVEEPEPTPIVEEEIIIEEPEPTPIVEEEIIIEEPEPTPIVEEEIIIEEPTPIVEEEIIVEEIKVEKKPKPEKVVAPKPEKVKEPKVIKEKPAPKKVAESKPEKVVAPKPEKVKEPKVVKEKPAPKKVAESKPVKTKKIIIDEPLPSVTRPSEVKGTGKGKAAFQDVELKKVKITTVKGEDIEGIDLKLASKPKNAKTYTFGANYEEAKKQIEAANKKLEEKKLAKLKGAKK